MLSCKCIRNVCFHIVIDSTSPDKPDESRVDGDQQSKETLKKSEKNKSENEDTAPTTNETNGDTKQKPETKENNEVEKSTEGDGTVAEEEEEEEGEYDEEGHYEGEEGYEGRNVYEEGELYEGEEDEYDENGEIIEHYPEEGEEDYPAEGVEGYENEELLNYEEGAEGEEYTGEIDESETLGVETFKETGGDTEGGKDSPEADPV